jgi:hypothetical protein
VICKHEWGGCFRVWMMGRGSGAALSGQDLLAGGSVGNWGRRGRRPSFDAIMGQLVGKAWEPVKAHSRITGFGAIIFMAGAILPRDFRVRG